MQKKASYWIRSVIAAGACVFALGLYCSPQMETIRSLADTYYLQPGQTRELPFLNEHSLSVEGESVEVRSSSDESLQDAISSSGVEINGLTEGNSQLTISMFGVPVKTVSVNVEQSRIVIPGGQAIGVKLYTKGALVVGTMSFETLGGSSVNPAREAGIEPGDVILAVNGVDVEDSDHLKELINDTEGPLNLVVESKDETTREVQIIPRLSADDNNELLLGLWVRDSTVGVGTLTLYDAKTNRFGALGHAITDIDTHSRMSVSHGNISLSKIIGIKQGQKGEPGELRGSFSDKDEIGTITKNTDFGIYGDGVENIKNSLYPDGLPIGLQDEVHAGSAEILSTIDDSGIQSFTCNITRVQSQSSPDQRGMVFEITDERLLSQTGGIVQGMSGSPIIQDGKLIGAVTHVFVNDPTRGYGMFIEWMLGEMDAS